MSPVPHPFPFTHLRGSSPDAGKLPPLIVYLKAASTRTSPPAFHPPEAFQAFSGTVCKEEGSLGAGQTPEG